MNIKESIRQILVKLNIPLTVNIRYDIDTVKILKKHLSSHSNCIDIGCHKGEIMDLFLKTSPQGRHYGFEPIPDLYSKLIDKYKGSNCRMLPYALSDWEGNSRFNLVESNPAYSGLMKRKYDRPNETDREIEVAVKQLDKLTEIVDSISMIKIDVEGAELGVLKGAENLIRRDNPLIIFEHGLGAADIYGTTPKMIFDFFSSMDYHIYTTNAFLRNQRNMNPEEFEKQFYESLNFYFVAAPSIKP